MGGTGTRFAIISDGKVLAVSEVPTGELVAGTPTERVSRVAAVVTGLLPEEYLLEGVGIVASGPVLLPSGCHRRVCTWARQRFDSGGPIFKWRP